MDKVNLAEKFAKVSEHWSPKVVGALDDYEIKVVKLQGEFVWHSHADADEMFLVVGGRVTIRLRERDVNLAPGELFVVPRGVEHMPVAKDECRVLLIERKGTVNTGDADDPRTVRDLERI